MPNAEYAPKREYLDILVKTVDISELIDVRVGTKTYAFYLQSNECVWRMLFILQLYLYFLEFKFFASKFWNFSRVYFLLKILDFNIT